MKDSLIGFLFGVGAMLIIGAALFRDDSSHMSRNPHHLAE
jgi:hypothetical protein